MPLRKTLRNKTLRNKTLRKTLRNKSILRKGKRAPKRRTRRVRFLGGATGTPWIVASNGSRTEKEFQQYQEYREMNPEAY